MLTFKTALFGERSVTKVAALFASNEKAQQAAQQLIEHAHFDPSQVRILNPSDRPANLGKSVGRNIEPEQQGIWRTLVRSHITFGLLGLCAGVLLLGVLMLADVQSVLSSPFLSLFAFAILGLFLGLMFGGAITMRPDHGHIVTVVEKGLESGQSAVIVHPTNSDQTHEAMKRLESGSEKIVRSL